MGTSNNALKKLSKIIFLGFSINEPFTSKMMLVGNPIKKSRESLLEKNSINRSGCM
jgi:hypothetical protein